MRHLYRMVLTMIMLLVTTGDVAWGQLEYVMTVGSGKTISPKSTTRLHALRMGNRRNTAGETVSIGLPFTFNFDGVGYTKVSVSNNGLVGLGNTTVTSSNSNDLVGAAVPILAPFWDALRLGSRNNAVTWYGVSGSAPDQIFVVAYEGLNFNTSGNSRSQATFQVRLYEGSNKIEFYYGTMSNNGSSTSASIGLAVSPSKFLSITPSGSAASISYTSVNNYVDLNGNAIDSDVMYTFLPCTIGITGNVEQGGTNNMLDGDKLLAGRSAERYRPTPFTPSNLTFHASCISRTYTMTISGPSASEYRLPQPGGTIRAGEILTPVIEFTPTQLGVRPATLLVTDDNHFSRSFNLAGEGGSRIIWSGNAAQGGLSSPRHLDTLLGAMRVKRLGTAEYAPLSVGVPVNRDAPSAQITYTVNDFSGRGQYSFRHPVTGNDVSTYTTTVAPGGNDIPVIRFMPTGVGYQLALLTVVADGETRSFFLKPYSIAPGGEFYLGTDGMGPATQVFQKDFSCAGEALVGYDIDVRNIGDGDFNILGVRAFLTDTMYGQGIPRYPLKRDANGQPFPVDDYFITEYPAVAPFSDNVIVYPMTVPYLTQRRMRLNFVAQEPGKRFARLYIYTNGKNFVDIDPYGNRVEGLVAFDMFGRGLGARPGRSVGSEARPRPLLFERTLIGDTAFATTSICNTGTCDMRIGRREFRVASGDNREFIIVDPFPGVMIDRNGANETWVIPPDGCGTFSVAFIPTRHGSRRATVRLQTNDSAMFTPGFAERGAYYLDLYGYGSVGLDASEVSFGDRLINDPGDGWKRETAYLQSTTREYIVIDSLAIVGPDAGEFMMDPANPWPAVPFLIDPGMQIALGLRHRPAPASGPGERRAQLLLFTSSGDTVRVDLRAWAGTRTLAVGPTSLFEDVTTTVGKRVRRTLSITNTGTMPLRLGTTTVVGTEARHYLPGPLPRLVLSPGQTEYLEVTYLPTDKGKSTGRLDVMSDATNGVQSVVLGGTAAAVSSAPGTTGAGAVTLGPAQPNPARADVELSYTLAESGDVDLRLYDETGRECAVLERGPRGAGFHSVRFRTDALPGGAYRYVLSAGGVILTGSMTVVR